MANQNEVIKTVMTLAEVHGKTMSEAAAELYVRAISDFPPDVLMEALGTCMREVPRFPTAADVVARCERLDGRPGVEEAWALVPKDEYGSVVWTDEMSAAFGACYPLMEEDLVAARMAFKESYERLVREARRAGRRTRWSPSLGIDKRGRERAMVDAIECKRIDASTALAWMPELSDNGSVNRMIAETVRRTLPNADF